MTRTLLALIGLTLALDATAQIYRCEGEGGVVEYSNNVAPGREGRCRKVDLPEITTIPAPKPPPGVPGKGGAAGSFATPGTPPGAASGKAGPADFPRVDAATQKSRDSDRRQIIEDELRKEEGKLATLKSEYKDGKPERRGDERNYQKYLDRVERLKTEISRTDANIVTLKRELGSIRD